MTTSRDSSREVERRILLCGTRRRRNRKCLFHLSSLRGGSRFVVRACSGTWDERATFLSGVLPGKLSRARARGIFTATSRYPPRPLHHARAGMQAFSAIYHRPTCESFSHRDSRDRNVSEDTGCTRVGSRRLIGILFFCIDATRGVCFVGCSMRGSSDLVSRSYRGGIILSVAMRRKNTRIRSKL